MKWRQTNKVVSAWSVCRTLSGSFRVSTSNVYLYEESAIFQSFKTIVVNLGVVLGNNCPGNNWLRSAEHTARDHGVHPDGGFGDSLRSVKETWRFG